MVLPDPSSAAAVACAHLVDYLPSQLAGARSRVVQPKSPLVHAWGSPPIVMRCGVPKPAGYDPNSPLTATVDGVTWFQQTKGTNVIWTAVRASANVELVVPTSYQGQGGFLVELGHAITRGMP